MVILKASGKLHLSNYGKDLRSLAMYQKGREFIVAALLLRNEDRAGYVYLHLVCQGVEIIFKSLLLFKDYKTYKPKLGNRKLFGHDLCKVVNVWSKKLNGGRVNKKFYKEIEALNDHYKGHNLRYGSNLDIFLTPRSFKTTEIIRQLQRTLLKTNKMLERKGLMDK